MIVRLLVAGFLLAHGAIHAGFISPRPPATAGGPPWPFELGRSWILSPLGVDPMVLRFVGLALVAATLAGLALGAVGALGILPPSVSAPSAAVGAVASMALLLLFFHPWLVLGLLIDVVLLWAVLVAGWRPDAIGIET